MIPTLSLTHETMSHHLPPHLLKAPSPSPSSPSLLVVTPLIPAAMLTPPAPDAFFPAHCQFPGRLPFAELLLRSLLLSPLPPPSAWLLSSGTPSGSGMLTSCPQAPWQNRGKAHSRLRPLIHFPAPPTPPGWLPRCGQEHLQPHMYQAISPLPPCVLPTPPPLPPSLASSSLLTQTSPVCSTWCNPAGFAMWSGTPPARLHAYQLFLLSGSSETLQNKIKMKHKSNSILARNREWPDCSAEYA